MKRLFIASICLCVFSAQLKAQPKKSGAIQFESTFEPAAMAAANGIKLSDEAIARMPKSSVTNFELLFNLTGASYVPVEDQDDSNGGGGNGPGPGMGGGMRFGGFGGGNKEYYYNFSDHKLTEVFDLNDTTFFMQDKLGEFQKMAFGPDQSAPEVEYIKSDEVRKILGFTCNKVVVKTKVKRRIMEEEKEITDETNVWYTNDLGFDFSPNPSLWTSGAVLAIEGKATHMFAKSIEYRKVSVKDVSLPKKGTLITAEEFHQKMEQRRKLMRANRNNAKGQVRSITIN